MLAVYASQDGLLHHHARLASGCRPCSTGWDCLPTGLQRKVSTTYIYIASSFPELAWRKYEPFLIGGPAAVGGWGPPLEPFLIGGPAADGGWGPPLEPFLIG